MLKAPICLIKFNEYVFWGKYKMPVAKYSYVNMHNQTFQYPWGAVVRSAEIYISVNISQ